MAARYAERSPKSPHVATFAMRVLVQAGTPTCMQVLDKIVAAVHATLTERSHQVTRRMCVVVDCRHAHHTHSPRVSVHQLDELAAANEGVSMFPDVKDEERGTPLWVAEQRAAVEDHLSELEGIANSPCGVCILDWQPPALPGTAYTDFERTMLMPSPSVRVLYG